MQWSRAPTSHTVRNLSVPTVGPPHTWSPTVDLPLEQPRVTCECLGVSRHVQFKPVLSVGQL